MSDPSQPSVYTHDIPAQRTSFEHAMAPDPSSMVYVPVEVAPDEPYGHWGLRVAATLIDAALQIPFLVVQAVGLMIAFDAGGLTLNTNPDTVGTDGYLVIDSALVTTATWVGLALFSVAGMSWTVFSIRNQVVRQGRTGASIGKSCMNLMVVSEADGRPIGAPMTLVRGWVHLIDLIPAGLGYLWPLWDRRRQTFTDMIMKTAVLHLPPEPPVQIPQQASAPYYA